MAHMFHPQSTPSLAGHDTVLTQCCASRKPVLFDVASFVRLLFGPCVTHRGILTSMTLSDRLAWTRSQAAGCGRSGDLSSTLAEHLSGPNPLLETWLPAAPAPSLIEALGANVGMGWTGRE